MTALANIKDASLKLQQALKAIMNKTTLTHLGEMAADMIRTRTRLGYGVEDNGKPRQKLKPLSESYKEQRKRNKGTLNEDTTPNKSNLTLSGSMLDSIKPKKVTNTTVFVGPTGSRNEKVAGYVTEQGRSFNALSDVEQKRLKDEARKILQETLKRELSKVR